MRSERYNISLFGVDSKYYTDDFVAHLWEESANKQYELNGGYVTALRNIVMEVREKLNNPAMTIVIESVDFYYFGNV